MALVGDIIMSAREEGPDFPQSLGAPTGITYSVVAQTPSTLTPGTYIVETTQVTPWGESIPAAESSGQVVGANQGIQVAGTLDPRASGVRAYFTLPGGATGTESRYVASSTLPFIIGSTLPIAGGQPPTIGSAWLPDTDGNTFSAYTLYRWLNDALAIGNAIAGGLKVLSGSQAIVGQPLYVIPGEWQRIESAWFDGWPLFPDRSTNFYYHNTTQGISASISVEEVTNRAVVQLFWQPNRSGGTTTLNPGIGAADVTANVVSSSSFLNLGLVQFGSGPTAEIAGYQGLGASGFANLQLTNLLRGLGGTVAQAWPTGTLATELNIRIAGLRTGITYTVGSALSTLPIPSNWLPPLKSYVLGRFRRAEQDDESGQIVAREFEMWMEKYGRWKYPTRTQIPADSQRETYGGTLGGGWLIP
jgi:hypothetical protein